MRIHRLRLRNYRGVSDREVRFATSGVTVVQGANEVGKTSLAEALDLLLEHYDDTTRAAVRATKPVHRDAGAEVEAELSAGHYRFTYAKRFHKDRYTTLTVHEPSRSQHTGRDAHDTVRKILAETVDEALWQALRLPQGVGGGEQADLRAQTSLARALDRVAAGAAGGPREADLFARVTAEYHRYHTRSGKPAKLVKDTVDAHEAARHEAELARKQLAEVDADAERCAQLERALADLRVRDADQRTRLPVLERAWSEVRERQAEVDRLRLASELAAAAADAAVAARDERRRLVAEQAQSAQVAADLRARADAAEPAAAAAAAAHSRAERRRRELEADVENARAGAASARAACDRQRDRLDLELLAERYERVVAAQRDAAAAAETLDGARVDTSLLARIEAAHLDLVQARARLEGEHPVVEVTVHGAPGARVGERTVGTGDTLAVPAADHVEVVVPGVAAVRVRPGEGVRALAEARDAAADALAACLAEGGVDGVEAARAAARRREQAERALSEAHAALQRDLRDLTPDLLADKVRRLRLRVGDEELPTDLDDARREVTAAEAHVEGRAELLADAERDVERAVAERDQARREEAELAARADAAEAAAAERTETLGAARTREADEWLDQRVAASADAAGGARRTLEGAEAALAAADPEATEATLANARDGLSRTAAELRSIEGDLRETRARVEVRGEEGLADRVAAAERRMAATGAERERLQARAAAARLLYETMSARRDEARRAYAAPFRERIVALGRVVFGPDLDVELDEDLAITSRTLAGRTVDFGELSAGAREQLAVVARLACAAITAQDGGVPLLLDDALGASDPARLEALGAVFAVAARDAQVIVLTCVPERYRHIGSATVVRLD